jgi:hypothetical protein
MRLARVVLRKQEPQKQYKTNDSSNRVATTKPDSRPLSSLSVIFANIRSYSRGSLWEIVLNLPAGRSSLRKEGE